MKRYFLFFLLLCYSAVFGVNQSPEKIASYEMQVVLHPESKIISGTQNIVWKNTSAAPVQEIYFHAYLNAFKNTNSSFLKAAASDPQWTLFGKDWPKDGWGYLNVKSINARFTANDNPVDITSTITYVQPNDNNPDDQTVFKIALPQPLSSGASVTFTTEFDAKLPYKGFRAGFKNNFYIAAQWFPKIGVLQNGEWKCHQYVRCTEFFADFGDYDVSITLPENYLVGATGVLIDSVVTDNSKTLHFVQQNVHDFAWSACPDFISVNKSFNRAALPPINIHLLCMPDHKNRINQYLDAITNAIPLYDNWFYPYPYSQITIIDTPDDVRMGSMEYPAFMVIQAPTFGDLGVKPLYWSTVHEYAHQYWYGLIATDEFTHPWMDESFASYVDTRCLSTMWDTMHYTIKFLEHDSFKIPMVLRHVKINPLLPRLDAYRKKAFQGIINSSVIEYPDHLSYRAFSYQKGSLMLWTLENYLGEDTWSQIIQAYAKRYTYLHPEPQDFINIVNEFSPEPMNWFFDQVLETNGILDYAVDEITSKPAAAMHGLGNELHLTPKIKSDIKLVNSRVVVKRLGTVHIPVDVRITFENGDIVNDKWDGIETWKQYQFSKESGILRVDIDPDRILWLDVDYTNNSLFRKKSSFAAFIWGTKWLFWLQHLFETVACFA